MKAIQKIRNNILSAAAITTLGLANYLRYLATTITKLPKILYAGNLSAIDKFMGRFANKFSYRGMAFNYDCSFCDQNLSEETYAFGIVREIYIRDCYFKWHPHTTFENSRIVVDLGANRGVFSALMTTKAEFILCVEQGEQYVPIIRHNLGQNGFTNYAIESVLVGAGGVLGELNGPRLTIEELFNKHHIDTVDLIKIDIEGSEFSLFESPAWLQRVHAISMEVHPHYGNTGMILDMLTKNGFAFNIADENLHRISNRADVSFVYAWRTA